ncbi:MAG: hypothetical protein FJX75_14940 [Armatimonadetes bacterium]|nr:hypothetical protein [Armatimonadota bacterium]
MDTREVPVDERTYSAAHWALYVVLALPTLAVLVVGAVLKLSGQARGASFSGLLGWIVVIGVVQLAIVLVGRTQYVSGVRMVVDEGARPPESDAGIFRHG